MTDYIKNSAFCKLGVTQKSRNIKGKNDQLDRDKIKLLSFERRATKKIDNPQTGREFEKYKGLIKIQRIDSICKEVLYINKKTYYTKQIWKTFKQMLQIKPQK